ncbi:hypothetical protein J6590_034412 [Homalodisca vitripennis]|nr:hypothetical protein J6590_034412 [Homalodisca vitripennis]
MDAPRSRSLPPQRPNRYDDKAARRQRWLEAGASAMAETWTQRKSRTGACRQVGSARQQSKAAVEAVAYEVAHTAKTKTQTPGIARGVRHCAIPPIYIPSLCSRIGHEIVGFLPAASVFIGIPLFALLNRRAQVPHRLGNGRLCQAASGHTPPSPPPHQWLTFPHSSSSRNYDTSSRLSFSPDVLSAWEETNKCDKNEAKTNE